MILFLTFIFFSWSNPEFLTFRIWTALCIKKSGQMKKMASSAEYEKYDSAVDNIISIVRRSHLGKPVDELFLIDLKSMIENKMIDAGVKKTSQSSSGIYFQHWIRTFSIAKRNPCQNLWIPRHPGYQSMCSNLPPIEHDRAIGNNCIESGNYGTDMSSIVCLVRAWQIW